MELSPCNYDPYSAFPSPCKLVKGSLDKIERVGFVQPGDKNAQSRP